MFFCQHVKAITHVVELLSPRAGSDLNEWGYAAFAESLREKELYDSSCSLGLRNYWEAMKSTRPGKVYQSKGTSSFRVVRRMARRRYPPPTNARPTVMTTDTRATMPTIEDICLKPAKFVPEITLLFFNFSVSSRR